MTKTTTKEITLNQLKRLLGRLSRQLQGGGDHFDFEIGKGMYVAIDWGSTDEDSGTKLYIYYPEARSLEGNAYVYSYNGSRFAGDIPGAGPGRKEDWADDD